MRNAGVVAEMTRETDLPFAVAGAIRVDHQSQFHPIKYLAGLAARLPRDGSHVFEQTRATAVESGKPAVVNAASGRVRAAHVVVATQLPFLDRGFLFAKAHPQKSFAVSAEIDEKSAPRGMYISIDEPTRSIRSAPAGAARRHLIVGGESRRLGDGNDEAAYRALEESMKKEFGVEADLRWSAHDYVPVDGLPYMGRLRRGDERVYVATGFAKWGLTKATIAARIITDAIVGRSNSSARLYDAGRLAPRASAVSLVARTGGWPVAHRRPTSPWVRHRDTRSRRGRNRPGRTPAPGRVPRRIRHEARPHSPLPAPRLPRRVERGGSEVGMPLSRLALLGRRRASPRPRHDRVGGRAV
jgi:glycine/D-amino acid oxidase-like deaminating enzyme